METIITSRVENPNNDRGVNSTFAIGRESASQCVYYSVVEGNTKEGEGGSLGERNATQCVWRKRV